MTDFLTSDLHFGHAAILGYTERPWATPEEMDEALIEDWNGAVKPADRVFVVGDFSFHKGAETDKILSRLNGQKFLVKGNHDHTKELDATTRWQWVRSMHTHRVGGDAVVLCHFPMLAWLNAHRGFYHCHGHCHGTLRLPEEMKAARIFDVGVDATVKLTGSYRPTAWEEIREALKGKGPVSVDGHKVKNGT